MPAGRAPASRLGAPKTSAQLAGRIIAAHWVACARRLDLIDAASAASLWTRCGSPGAATGCVRHSL